VVFYKFTDVSVGRICCCLLADFMVGMLFDPDDGGNMFLQEVNKIHGITWQKIVRFMVQGV
jgi:hypothetical protein